MTSTEPRRVLPVLIATTAICGGATICAAPTATAAPLLPEGSSPPVAAAHLDDMGDRSGGADAAAKTRRPPPLLREPVTLEVPDLGIETAVVRTSMDANGAVLVPEDILVTGWFDGGRRLDARQGNTVIVGHRDSATQGSGALYAIEDIPVGSKITVTGRDGTPYAYDVTSVEFIDKANLPGEAARVFTRYGPHRLVLITCGGAFDESAGSYLSNIVVTAVPVPDSSTL